LLQTELSDSSMAQQTTIEALAMVAACHYEQLQFSWDVPEHRLELPDKLVHLREGHWVWLIHHGYPDAAVRQPEHKLIPQVRLTAALGQGIGGIARVCERGDLLFVIEYEFGRPAARFEVEIHTQEPRLHGCERVPASGTRVAPQQTGGGRRDLIYDRISRDFPQEADPLQLEGIPFPKIANTMPSPPPTTS
jgi:hypothetical protein